MNKYKVIVCLESEFEETLNKSVEDGWEPYGNMIYSRDDDDIHWFLSIMLERKTDIKYANELLAAAAESVYQNNVIEPEMEDILIGKGKEYADKQDWIESWLQWLSDTVSTQSSEN